MFINENLKQKEISIINEEWDWLNKKIDWAKEKGERGRLARENKEECLKKYGGYLGEHNKSGYKVTESKKKIVFVKPLVKNWKKILNDF